MNTRWQWVGMSLAAVLCTLTCLDASAQDDRKVSPVRQVDHIMIRSGEPGGLFALFTGTFQLPVAWPLVTRRGVTTGGVGFGNVNVESIRFPGQHDRPSSLVGFALEPAASLHQSLTELDRRRIAYGEQRRFVISRPDGSKETLWTNVTLAQFSDSDRPVDGRMHVFLSEYSPSYVNVNQRRERLRRALVENGGGPLGVMGVAEVTIGTMDMAKSTQLWGNLLAPQDASAEGLWHVGDGPAIRLVQSTENAMQGFVIAVASLKRAEAFLLEKALLGSVSDGEITMDASKVEGLHIRLVEKE
jgi:hypothetical protein